MASSKARYLSILANTINSSGKTTTPSVNDGSITPSKLSTGGLSWNNTGSVTVTGDVTATQFIGDGSLLTIPISSVTDIDISNPSDGDILVYNGTTLLWESKSSFDQSVVTAIALG